MKKLKGFKLANVTLASALALALSGCADDPIDDSIIAPDPGDTAKVALSGKTADGYLKDATICLDLNANKMCDAGEPTAVSTAGGAFTIPGVTQTQIDSNPLLVEIEAGKTIDEDFPDTVLTKSYQLSAPAGYTFISPLTTLIQNVIETQGSSAAAAELAVQTLLGTDLDLGTDYIAGKTSGSNQAEFEKLHKVAQVAARVVATNMDEYKDQVAAGDFTVADLSSEVMTKVFAELDDITSQVDSAIDAGGEFDLDSIVNDINEKIDLDVQPSTKQYVLISSTGKESEINENTEIGEWSTGSVIDAEGNYQDLDAWIITKGPDSDNSWGSVLALTGGFEGDFSEFDKLSIKIATTGGYSGGYFIKIGSAGSESGDIALSVDDAVTGWQDAEVDLSNYDLSSIEYISIFAIGGTAGVSKIHIADLSLGQDNSVPVEIIEEYALISSTGAESKINENTEVGEWSTGSVIDSESNYDGLNAWMVTSGGSWGTVLAFSGGFDGDFSEFDELRVKIATTGGYADGYFLKIQTNGVESADIPLTVSDSTTGWQDVIVDLENYDLTSIEYITLFAKTGAANFSKLYIADLALVQLEDPGTSVPAPDPDKVVLDEKVSEAAEFVEADYTVATWAIITAALAMPETTQAEMIAKTAAITAAIDGLVETDPVAVDVTALSAAITTADNNLSLTTIGDEVGQVSQADWQAFSDALTAAEVIRDAAASQTAINQAIIDLASAQTDFNNSKVGTVITEPELELGPNLVVNGDFDSSDLADNVGSVGQWNYYTNTGTVVAIADSQMTAVVTSVGEGQWDNQIWNQIQVTEEGDYVVKLTASSTVDRDILIRVDAIGMNGNGTTSTNSDVIAHLTSTPQEFKLYVSGSAFTADAAFKLVTSLGVLEAANTTSVASTVTFDDVYLGTLAEAVPVEMAELETAISTAQVLHDGGADETLKAAYQAAIDVAQAVVDDVDATQTDVDAALAALAIATSEFDPSIEVPEEGNLVVNGNFADSTVGTGSDVGQWNYYTSTGTVVAIADGDMTAEVTEVGGQWDNQITNEVHVTEEGAYVVKVTASSTVDRDILIRVDGIEMGNDGTLSTASDIIANLTSTPQTFTRYFNGLGFTNNARFKVVMSVGGLEAAGTTSVASTVTFHDVYLGTFTGDIPTDIATLSSAITVATNVFNAAVEGTEIGQYTTSKADLQAAIDAAQDLVDTLDITQEQADAALASLTAARTTFEAGLVVEAIPGAQILTTAGDINFTPDSWGTNTAQNLLYDGDATYSPSIELVGGGSWGTVLAMTGIPAGTLAQFTSIDIKVKTTDFTEIKVKVPEVEMGYALSTGTDLGNGWVQLSIPMSDFGDAAPAAAEQFAIFGIGGTGTILLSEISFSND
ncbi:hypothetical protein GCM10007916_23140 [Psychromonas marina]|uniref:Carbohydrate binding domain-containing protein n=1 Tax=Psychromonas marina TaxID=88364 RepID=A0ABQ6E225_9GAMM|nr:hypothetical protein [Psychromonas marina]GLS91245.1 hypothetical protein GCM10007916_23140 [Psychromonas marina]